MIEFDSKRYGKRPFSVSFLIIGLVLFYWAAIPGVLQAESTDYVDDLIAEAHTRNLSGERYWHILLHYKQTLFGVESVVDDPNFFLSENGKTDPRGELDALIRDFFDPAHAQDAPPICRFFARYTWVKEQLQPDPEKIPSFGCPSVEKLEPRSATLVFPTYYLNNPASMFGHTFITIETGYSHVLLTDAVNYAAFAGDAGGFEYAVYGIFGGFQGYFTMLPYYEKIKEYSDIDQRDIWEYRLNLTPDELKKMLYHIWEMEGIGTDYYFFSENCSYHLLYLFEAARPSLRLTDAFGLWVIPIDTVKAVKKQGVIEDAHFRPSNGTKLRQMMAGLPPHFQELAYDISRGTQPVQVIDELDTDRDQKILVSDLVGETMKYRLMKQEVTQPEYQAVAMPNLRLRSRLGKPETPFQITVPVDPSEGHDASRLTLSFGHRHHQFFQEIGINPSFSDLLNTDYTSREGIQIQFLDTRVRYYDSDRDVRLERLDILDIVSLFPRNRFFKPLSWKLSTGFRRQSLADGSRGMMYRLNSGTGLSWQVPYAGLLFVLPELELRLSRDLEDDVAGGLGLYGGLMKEVLPNWKILLTAETLYFTPDDNYTENRVSLEQNLKLSRNNRINLTLLREEAFDHGVYEASLSWQHYF